MECENRGSVLCRSSAGNIVHLPTVCGCWKCKACRQEIIEKHRKNIESVTEGLEYMYLSTCPAKHWFSRIHPRIYRRNARYVRIHDGGTLWIFTDKYIPGSARIRQDDAVRRIMGKLHRQHQKCIWYSRSWQPAGRDRSDLKAIPDTFGIPVSEFRDVMEANRIRVREHGVETIAITHMYDDLTMAMILSDIRDFHAHKSLYYLEELQGLVLTDSSNGAAVPWLFSEPQFEGATGYD